MAGRRLTLLPLVESPPTFRNAWDLLVSSVKVTLGAGRMLGWALVAAAIKRMDRATDGE